MRKFFEEHPEEMELLKESKLTPDQFRFLKKCLVEVNRRECIQYLASDKVKELDRLTRESEEASNDFTIPGSEAGEKGKLDFDLNYAISWREKFGLFEHYRGKKEAILAIAAREKIQNPDTSSIEELTVAEENSRNADDALKKYIEEFEREKSKAKVSEKELGEARKKAEEAFEEREKE